MGDVFPEVRAKQKTIQETIRREEDSFNKTLDKGIELFESEVGRGVSKISGAFAFRLYDEQGFPLDLTELMARERGLTVDVSDFEKLMDRQRDRARKAQKKETIAVEAGEIKGSPTKFLGYDFLETEAVVETVLPGKRADEINIVLDRTPCYAEMGGQVGDRGLVHVPGRDRTEVGQLRVTDTQKRGETYIHRTQLVEGRAPEAGEAIRISVDVDRRKLIQGHHTVTHLLHWALHEVVSKDAAQKGSYVGPDKLTFDFSSAALTSQQKRDVEKLVNEKIAENAPVSWTEIPYAEAKKNKEIQQFFGEKYGDKVRVLQIGGQPKKLNGYSMELCGGTHVRSTSEIGPAARAASSSLSAIASSSRSRRGPRNASVTCRFSGGTSRKSPGGIALCHSTTRSSASAGSVRAQNRRTFASPATLPAEVIRLCHGSVTRDAGADAAPRPPHATGSSPGRPAA